MTVAIDGACSFVYMCNSNEYSKLSKQAKAKLIHGDPKV